MTPSIKRAVGVFVEIRLSLYRSLAGLRTTRSSSAPPSASQPVVVSHKSTVHPRGSRRNIPKASCNRDMPYKSPVSLSAIPAPKASDSLEVVAAHGLVTSVPVQALDALGGGLLARIVVLAAALPAGALAAVLVQREKGCVRVPLELALRFFGPGVLA